MRNKNKTVWSNRFGRANSKNFQRIGSSINIDKRLYNEDIQASIVHVQMLAKKKIIPRKDGIKIIKGLKKLKLKSIKINLNSRRSLKIFIKILRRDFFKLLGTLRVTCIQRDQETIKLLLILKCG